MHAFRIVTESSPRRRRSIFGFAISGWEGMDSRLRGNDVMVLRMSEMWSGAVPSSASARLDSRSPVGEGWLENVRRPLRIDCSKA